MKGTKVKMKLRNWQGTAEVKVQSSPRRTDQVIIIMKMTHKIKSFFN